MMYDTSRELKSVDSNILVENKKLELLRQYLNSTNKIKNQVGYYLNETWIKDVSCSLGKSILTKNIFRNKNYLEIYELHNRLKSLKDNKFNKKQFIHRRTSNIFEIYVFLLVKDMFEELGFRWTKGWLKNVKNIESLININLDSQIISSFVSNRQPDILISVYKDNTFIKSMVIEAKYRRKSYIYNEENNTDVIYQVLSYRNFVYYDGEIGKVSMRYKKPIDKVIVLYICDEDKFTHDMYDDIEFIAINPIYKGEQSERYSDIKNEINKLLEI